MCDPPVVFTARLCDRWAQRALQPISAPYRRPLGVTIWVFISRSPPTGGSLGFDVPASVEKLKFTGGGWWRGGARK